MELEPLHIRISVRDQTLRLAGAAQKIYYPISTARLGVGCGFGSFRTPTGLHRVRIKIGAGLPINSILAARRPTGMLLDDELQHSNPGRDWILTRILWLDGLELGINKGGLVDTLRRHIYIHGTADEASIGKPASHGCIRMRNADLVDLFDRVQNGVQVVIEA